MKTFPEFRGYLNELFGFGQERHGGYYWEKDPAGPKCPNGITWKQVKPEQMPGLCGHTTKAGKFKGADAYACTFNQKSDDGKCLTVSPYSEDEAKRFKTAPQDDDDTLYTHELRHAKDGMRHPDNSPDRE